MFAGGIEMKHWLKIGQNKLINQLLFGSRGTKNGSQDHVFGFEK